MKVKTSNIGKGKIVLTPETDFEKEFLDDFWNKNGKEQFFQVVEINSKS